MSCLKQRDVYLCIYDAAKKTMYTDLTSSFPVISQRGHKYIMVAIELDGNYIDAECLNHTKPTISSKPTRPYTSAGMTPRSFTSIGMSSTTRHLASSKPPSAATVAPSNSPYLTFTNATMPIVSSRLLRAISLPFSLVWTPPSLSMNGTACYHRPSSL